MAKSVQKNKAALLRREGNSIKDIAKILCVSKSSASLWCRDINLTPQQIEKLHLQMVDGNYKGRIKGALTNKKKYKEKVERYIAEGANNIGKLSERDFLMVGLGLYLGEGGKGRSFQFTNSNPAIITLMISSLRRCFDVPAADLVMRVFMNEAHKQRENEIIAFWASLLKIPNLQFRKTIFIKSVSKKIYANPERYFGVLNVRIKNSGDLQKRIDGLNYHILQAA